MIIYDNNLKSFTNKDIKDFIEALTPVAKDFIDRYDIYDTFNGYIKQDLAKLNILDSDEPEILYVYRVHYLKEYKIKCYLEFVSLSKFDIARYNISSPLLYIEEYQMNKNDTQLGYFQNDNFFTVVNVHFINKTGIPSKQKQ